MKGSAPEPDHTSKLNQTPVASPGRAPKVSRSLETAQLPQKAATVDGRSTVVSLFCGMRTEAGGKGGVLLWITAS